MSDFRFAATREHDILMAMTAASPSSGNAIGARWWSGGAWGVDEVGALIASTRADGVQLVTMMDERLESVFRSIEFEESARKVLVDDGAAYVLASNISCSTL
jgi:hypothetical protein